MVDKADPKTNGQRDGRNVVHQDGSRNSLLGRVGTSASALLREAVLRPRPEDLTAGLGPSSAGSSKGESSSSPLNASSSSSLYLREQSAAHSHATAPRYEDSFRTRQQRLPDLSESAKTEFDTFITTSDHFPGGPLVYNSLLDASMPYKGKEKMYGDGDGAAVVKLLSNPDFATDELPDPLYEPGPSEEHTTLWEANEHTQEILTSLKADLPPVPVHRIPSPDNPLNLLPNFNNQTRVFGKEYTEASSKSQSSGLYVIATPPGAQLDLEPWLGVLTNYQDDVWGDLLPLVKEARQEVRNAMEGSKVTLKDCPAVRRLGMILGHIQSP